MTIFVPIIACFLGAFVCIGAAIYVRKNKRR